MNFYFFTADAGWMRRKLRAVQTKFATGRFRKATGYKFSLYRSQFSVKSDAEFEVGSES